MNEVQLKPGDLVTVKGHQENVHVIVGAKDGLIYTMPIRMNDLGSMSMSSLPGSVEKEQINYIEPEEGEDEEDRLALNLDEIILLYDKYLKEKGRTLSQKEKDLLTSDFTTAVPIMIHRGRF